MNSNIDNAIENLRKVLPPLITRKSVERHLGGLISARTLANLDSTGKGPYGRVRLGRNVGYSKDEFLSWLADRLRKGDADV